MIFLSTPTFDLNGSVILKRTARSNIERRDRRVTRTATLDGGVAIADMGFTDGDRTLSIIAKRESIATEEAIRYLLENYPLTLCSTREGIYLGAISSMDRRGGDLTVTFLIKEKLSGD